MNEKIKQLKEQARDFYLLQEDLDCSIKELHELVDTKFAELLLNDVLAIVKNNTPNPDPYSRYDMQEAAERTANYIRDEIKYHFGVKE